MLYPTVGKEWFSSAWNNKKKRSIKENGLDPSDKSLGYTAGQPNAPLVINGDGTATTGKTSSARIYVKGPWTNTEQTVYYRIRGSTRNIQIRSRSDHPAMNGKPGPCGFGDYLAKWGDGGKVSIEVEVLHPIYHRHLNEKPYSLPINKWVGIKQITRTMGGNKVFVEAYVNETPENQANWIKQTDFTFDGTNVPIDVGSYDNIRAGCVGKQDKVANNLAASTLWLKPGIWSWLRLDDTDTVDLKCWSIREIAPVT